MKHVLGGGCAVLLLAGLGCDGATVARDAALPPDREQDASAPPLEDASAPPLEDAGDGGNADGGEIPGSCKSDDDCSESRYCSDNDLCVERCGEGRCLGPKAPAGIVSMLGVTETNTLYMATLHEPEVGASEGGLWSWDLKGAPTQLVNGMFERPDLRFAADGLLYFVDSMELKRVALSGDQAPERIHGSPVTNVWLTAQFVYWESHSSGGPVELWRKPRTSDGEAELVMANDHGPYIGLDEDRAYWEGPILEEAERWLMADRLTSPFTTEYIANLLDRYVAGTRHSVYSDGVHRVMEQYDGCIYRQTPTGACLTEDFSSDAQGRWTWFVQDSWLYWMTPAVSGREYQAYGRTRLDDPSTRNEFFRWYRGAEWFGNFAVVQDTVCYLDGPSQRIALIELKPSTPLAAPPP